MQRKHFFKVSISKLENALFGGSTNFFSSFFSVLALKTIDTQMLFWSVYLKSTKKVIHRQKQPKWSF